MESTYKSSQSNISLKKEATTTNVSTSDFWKKAEFNRFGITPMVLLVMSIFGGIAAASGILNSWVELAAVVFPSTICLALILSVSPMKAIVYSAVIAILVDILVIAF